MNALNNLFNQPRFGVTLLRWTLAILMIFHGWAKVTGGVGGTAPASANLGTMVPDAKLETFDLAMSDEELMRWDGNFKSDGDMLLPCTESEEVDVEMYRRYDIPAKVLSIHSVCSYTPPLNGSGMTP